MPEKGMREMAGTSRDVARLAGVSVATVSRVFAGGNAVKEETRQQVLQAARQLNYTPNTIARSLKANRSKTVGLVIPDIRNPYFFEVAAINEENVRIPNTIIVSAESSKKGQPLSSPTIHSIVSRYMSKANIKNWKQKKHGAHSLRHSLATNMLKKNISMPIISTVLGHQSTQSTKIYLSVDIKKLRECALPIPELFSAHYGKEV